MKSNLTTSSSVIQEVSKKAPKRNLQEVAEHLPDIVCRFDRNNFHVYVNPAIQAVTGVSPGVFIGHTPTDVMPPEFAAFWIKHIQKVFTTGKQTTMEFMFPTPEGDKYFQGLLVPERDKGGNVQTVLSISRDITAIKELEKEKDEFISVASHELKTPVTTVKAFAQILQQRLKTDDHTEYRYFVDRIVEQTDRLTMLVNDLLNVNRLESGRLAFHKKKFDITVLIKKTITNFSFTHDTHFVQFEGPGKKKVYADPDRIEQVIINLVTNAIKFSPKADKVLVNLSQEKGFALVKVQDFGFGIAKKDQQRIFDRFVRTSDKRKNKISGLGLGLYISSEIIKRHQGNMWVESEIGKGSTFCFSIPLKKHT